MSLSTAKLGLTTVFLTVCTSPALAILPPHTQPILSLPLGPEKTALAMACENPSQAYWDDNTYYMRVDGQLTAYMMPASDFQKNYDGETGLLHFPEDSPRIVCPV